MQINYLNNNLNTVLSGTVEVISSMYEQLQHIKTPSEMITGIIVNDTPAQSVDGNVSIEIPTTVSQLTNDAGYISSYTETDPEFARLSGDFALSSNVYTKEQADEKFLTEHQDISSKANVSDIISGININGVSATITNHIAEVSVSTSGQANIIEAINVNGTSTTIENKTVNINVPTDYLTDSTIAFVSTSGIPSATINNKILEIAIPTGMFAKQSDVDDLQINVDTLSTQLGDINTLLQRIIDGE